MGSSLFKKFYVGLSLLSLMASVFLFQNCGSGSGSDNSASPTTTAPAQKYIFSTSGPYLTCNFGGLAGADSLCNMHAQAANLSGNFKAWLSDDTNNAKDRIADVGPWYLVGSSTLVARNLATLELGSLQGNTSADENGNAIGSSANTAWTGTGPNGLKDTGNNCSNWTAIAGSAYVVDINSPSLAGVHFGVGNPSLPYVARLICIQQ